MCFLSLLLSISTGLTRRKELLERQLWNKGKGSGGGGKREGVLCAVRDKSMRMRRVVVLLWRRIEVEVGDGLDLEA